MSKWNKTNLGKIGQTITGKTPSSSTSSSFGSEFPFLTPSDSIDSKYIYITKRYLSNKGLRILREKIIPPESIMVSCIGSAMGKAIMNKETCVTNQQFNSIIPNKKKYSPSYIYYVLKNNYTALRNAALGSTALPILNKTDFDNLSFQIHESLDEQKKIASVLSVLDEKIELNNKINAELEAMAKTLYDYWFVQFDFPDPAGNGKPYKSSGGAMTYNEKLKRDIPAGWEDGTLDDILNIVRGVTYNGKDILNSKSENSIPVLRATNISGNVIDLNDKVYVPQSFVSKKQILKKFDVLIVMSSGSKNHIAKNGFYYFNEKVSFGAFCAVLRAKSNYKYYQYSFLQSKQFNLEVKNICLGTNINNLNGSLIKNIKIPIPKKDIINKFNEFVSPIFNRIEINQKENQALANLRDWLLPMLMNGQATVSD